MKLQNWLEKHQIWQIYKSPPKNIQRFHWTVSEVNKIHQADLLFLPHDLYKRKLYKYVSLIVDVASRYKDGEPLTSKNSLEVSNAFINIYSRKLTWPKILIVDPGREFMGELTSLMKKHNVKIQRSEAGNHRAHIFVENANKILGENIFSHQYAQEMLLKERERSREWVKRLPLLLKTMNNTPLKIIGTEANKTIDLKKCRIGEKHYERPAGFDEERLPGFVKVRYLYRYGKLEGEKNVLQIQIGV